MFLLAQLNGTAFILPANANMKMNTVAWEEGIFISIHTYTCFPPVRGAINTDGNTRAHNDNFGQWFVQV